MKRLLIAALVATSLAGCATRDPDVRYRGESMRMAQVQDGTVVAVRGVRVEGLETGTRAAVGMVTGAVAGSNMGGHRDAPVFAFLGAILGGVIGTAIERDAGTTQAVELIVQLRNGERVAIVQAKGQEEFRAGDAVMVISQGRSARVTRALPPVQPTSATEPGSLPR